MTFQRALAFATYLASKLTKLEPKKIPREREIQKKKREEENADSETLQRPSNKDY
jgi:hypothetical protein